MNVTLISCFRNSKRYLSRYIQYVTEFNNLIYENHTLTMIWGEGDSTDDTRDWLEKWAQRFDGAKVVDCTHGGQVDYQGVINEQRFKELGYVGRCMWAHIPQDADAVVYVESDLIWQPETILKLIDRLQDYPAIAPMVYLRRQGWAKDAFYDTWAARINGKHFEHYPPYCEGFDADKPFQVDSMGSCMAIRGELARKLVWDEQVFVGICRQLKEQGYGVWIDPTVAVYHT